MTTRRELETAIEEVGETPCSHYPDLFFPESGAGQRMYAPAKKLCATCPIQLICLDYALVNGEIHGMWGGLSANEREQIRRKRGLTAQQAWE